MRVTYRTLKVLAVIAAQPGSATSDHLRSNGISDQEPNLSPQPPACPVSG